MSMVGSLYVGVLSGKSADGMESVLLEIEEASSPAWRIRAHHHEPYSSPLRTRLLEIETATAAELCALHYALGEAAAECVLRLLTTASGWLQAGEVSRLPHFESAFGRGQSAPVDLSVFCR